MIRNNSYYKGSDFLNNDYKYRMNSYFNPYEYNLECNIDYSVSSDYKVMKSKNHEERKRIKK